MISDQWEKRAVERQATIELLLKWNGVLKRQQTIDAELIEELQEQAKDDAQLCAFYIAENKRYREAMEYAIKHAHPVGVRAKLRAALEAK